MTDAPPLPTTMDEDALRRMIGNLMPKSEVFSGVKFFNFLLDRRGVEGVLNFIRKASQALDKGNDLDLSYDFDEVEREAFKASRLELSRRNFLRTTAWQLGGAITIADAALNAGGKVVDLIKPTPSSTNGAPPSPPSNHLATAQQAVHNYGMPIAETLIGAALVYEGHDNRVEMKLEQVSDAVLQLAETLQKEHSKTRA